MATNYPAALDSYTTKVDAVDDVLASHINDPQDAIEALEAKVGVDSSAVATSLDYLVKNASSVNPGHHHSNAALDDVAFSKVTYTGLTGGQALFASAATTAAFRAIQETDIADGALLGRLAAAETVAGLWQFNAGLKIKSNGGAGILTLRAVNAATSLTLELPLADGTSGQVLTTDGSGVLSFQDAAAVPVGTSGQTLRHTGAAWAASSLIYNDGTNVGINKTSSLLGKLHVYSQWATAIYGSTDGGTGVAGVAIGGGKGVEGSTAKGSGGYFTASDNGTAVYAASLSSYALHAAQTGALSGTTSVAAALISRILTLGAYDATGAVLAVSDATASSGALFTATKLAKTRLSLLGTGELRLHGDTSGFVGFLPAAVAGSATYTLPSVDGNATNVLATDGAGVTAWASRAAPSYTTAARDLLTPENGLIIYNTTDGKIQGYENGAWRNLVEVSL